MKERKLVGRWTIGWYCFSEWRIGYTGADTDTDFEICLGRLQLLHWREG